MPLYDCMLLLKPHIKKEALTDLITKVGKHVCSRNGVITDLKYYGEVQLGYGIKKLDGKYFKGKMMQLTVMTPPSFNQELHYLNKEDRLLRWLLVRHRDFKTNLEFFGERQDSRLSVVLDQVSDFGSKKSEEDSDTDTDTDDDF